MVIPVHGTIGQHLDWIDVEYFGGCDLDAVNAAIEQAEEDDTINTVVFDFRTPGGTVTGIPECANAILELSQVYGKNTIAFTDSQCCSGGLYLAEQCERFFCTPSSRIGSCGVYSIFVDQSRMLEAAGIKVNAISAGEYKLSGAPFRPMTDDERAMFNERVQGIHADFKTAVNAIRSVDSAYLEGQVFDGKEAVKIGMADDIFMASEDMMDMLESDKA